MASPLETFQSFLRAEIASTFGRAVRASTLSASSALLQQGIVTRALRNTIESVGPFTGLHAMAEFARGRGIDTGFKEFYARARSEHDRWRAVDTLKSVSKGEVIPDKAISQSSWAFSREYNYKFTVTLYDENTGRRRRVTRSLVTNSRLTRSEAESQFVNRFSEGYGHDHLSIEAVKLIGVERRKEEPI